MTPPPLRQLLKLVNVRHPHWPIRSSGTRDVRRGASAPQQVLIRHLADPGAERGDVQRLVATGCVKHGSLNAGLKIAEQSVKGFSIRGMLVPVAEIANMPRTANIGRPWLRCFHYGFIDADREKDRLIVAVLTFACRVHFTLHPSALYRGIGQNDHYLVVNSNRHQKLRIHFRLSSGLSFDLQLNRNARVLLFPQLHQ